MTEEKTVKYEGGYDVGLMEIADNIEEIRDGFEFLTFAVFILGETFTFGYDTGNISLKGINRISGLLLKDMDGELEKLREKDKR